MIDVDHPNGVILIDDLIDDTIRSDPSRTKSGQVTSEWLADSMWVLEKGPQHEVENAYRNFLG